MQITLKDLFVFVAFCAVVAWCGAMTSFNGIFLAVTVVMAIAAALYVAIASRPYGKMIVCLLSPFFFYLALAFLSPVLLLFGLMIIVAIIVLAIFRNYSLRANAYGAMICIGISLVVGTIPGINALRSLRELRVEYPVLSLRPRLQSLHGWQRVLVTDKSDTTLSVEAELSALEDKLHGEPRRLGALAELHAIHYEQFIGSIGFGIMRLASPSRRIVYPLDLKSLPFAVSSEEVENESNIEWKAAQRLTKSSGIEQLHGTARIDFFDPDGFGAILSPEPKVVGFVPHAFHHPPTKALEDPTAITIDRLELVSLLKFAEPRVYVLDHLPRMDQLSAANVPTRPLDDFESAALEKLWTEQDIVTEEHDGRVRMLGSLRAAKQCLDCHSVQRGTLLGAFTYSIRQNHPAKTAAK